MAACRDRITIGTRQLVGRRAHATRMVTPDGQCQPMGNVSKRGMVGGAHRPTSRRPTMAQPVPVRAYPALSHPEFSQDRVLQLLCLGAGQLARVR